MWTLLTQWQANIQITDRFGALSPVIESALCAMPFCFREAGKGCAVRLGCIESLLCGSHSNSAITHISLLPASYRTAHI